MKESGLDVLVTGHTGFIGRSVVAHFDAHGIRWRGFTGDVRNPDDFAVHAECNAVLHLAGITRPGNGPKAAALLHDVNVLGAKNAALFAATGGRTFFFASTCCYDPQSPPPYAESAPLATLSPYWASKVEAENSLHALRASYGLRGVVFRIFNIYGPGQPNGFLVPDLLRILRLGRGSVYNLKDERDFVSVNDAVDLMRRAIVADHTGLHAVNIGSGKPTSVEEVLHRLQSLLGTTVAIESKGRRSGIPSSWADISVAQNSYGWVPRTSLGQGLTDVIQQEPQIPEN